MPTWISQFYVPVNILLGGVLQVCSVSVFEMHSVPKPPTPQFFFEFREW